MPFLSLTKTAKKYGIQTYAKAVRLPEPLRDVELEYLDARDWYVNTVSRIAQFDEALAQAKAEGDIAAQKEIGGKLHHLQASLVDARNRVKDIGQKSYAEAFLFVALKMLPHDARQAIELATERFLGRPMDELKRARK